MKNVADAVEALIGTYLQASYGFITIIIQLRFGPLRDRVVCKKYAYDTKKKKKQEFGLLARHCEALTVERDLNAYMLKPMYCIRFYYYRRDKDQT